MQCLYLVQSNLREPASTCNIVHNSYSTTEVDREKYCTTEHFYQCPRFTATIDMNKSRAATFNLEQNKK
jgi:hypothetical protein